MSSNFYNKLKKIKSAENIFACTKSKIMRTCRINNKTVLILKMNCLVCKQCFFILSFLKNKDHV